MPEPLTITMAALLMRYACSFTKQWELDSELCSDTAASIQHVTLVEPPTGVTLFSEENAPRVADSFDGSIAGSTGWMELACAVFGGSRSMTGEERAALDEFTWAELRS